RCGSPVLGHMPGEPRTLDEPLAPVRREALPDFAETEPAILRLRALECELAGIVLAHHFDIWEAFVAQYPTSLHQQPPSTTDARAIAKACASAFARGPDHVVATVEPLLDLAVRARLGRWLAYEPFQRIPADLRESLAEARSLRERVILS